MKRLILISALLAFVGNSDAYEFSTHAEMTKRAWNRMIGLDENKTLLVTLGVIKPTAPFFSATRYFDISGSDIRERSIQDWDRRQMERRGVPFATLPGWIVRGAMREDDDSKDSIPPKDDPYGEFHRVFRHFYDPANGSALTTLAGLDTCNWAFGLSLDTVDGPCATAVDWGLGTVDFRTTPPQLDANRRNHFTLADARESMYRAITGHAYADFSVTGLDFQTRQEYWVTAFRALGDVLHLNQDMAQPQHTRNDPHAGVTPTFVTGHKSAYEAFVEASIIGLTHLRVGTDTPQDGIPYTPLQPVYEGYPPAPADGPPDVVRFARYSEYWTNGEAGLADYSNRGFFTIGKNLGMSSNLYPLPANDPASYQATEVQATSWDGTTVPGKIIFYKGAVPDGYNPGAAASGIALSARGSWNTFMQPLGKSQFTLYRDNYVDQANLLIPRAIGYSAGLLNHFFRGRLQISLPSEQVYSVADYSTNSGFRTFKVMVKNISTIKNADGTTSLQQTDPTRKLVAVLRYRLNTCLKWPTLEGSPYWDPSGSGTSIWDEACRKPPLDTSAGQYLPDIKVSSPADMPTNTSIDQAPQPITFTFADPLPFNAVDVDLQVVYRGRLGLEEDDIAVGMEVMSEPTFFDFVNFSDCPGFQVQCSVDDGNSNCWYSGTAQLPLPDAVPAPGQTSVVSISNLRPGHYGRAAFLTQSAYRQSGAGGLEVVTNQVFDYPQPVTYPDGSGETWGPGVVVRGQLSKGRLIADGGGVTAPMYEWYAHGNYRVACLASGQCSTATWAAATCTGSISSQPVPVDISFPQQ